VYQLEVLDAAACAAMGMGCYLGVAEASLEPAKFIHLTYKPKGEVKKKVSSPQPAKAFTTFSVCDCVQGAVKTIAGQS
jgi:leucyl aminopeptidase